MRELSISMRNNFDSSARMDIHNMSLVHKTDPNFFALEGVDYSGKSTMIAEVAKRLKEQGYRVITTREPGGTLWAEKAREIAIHDESSTLAKLLMIHSGREDHINTLIVPALEAKTIVLSDRFSLSTFSYQRTGDDLHKDDFNASVTRNLESYWVRPNYIYVDISEKLWLQRLEEIGTTDALESESVDVYRFRRNTYIDEFNKNYGGLFLTTKEEADYEARIKAVVDFIKVTNTQND